MKALLILRAGFLKPLFCLLMVAVLTTSCEKIADEIIPPADEFNTPDVVFDNSLAAQSKAAATVNEKRAEYFYEIPTQNSTVWIDCSSSPFAILAMSKLPIIIDDKTITNKAGKRVRQITLCTIMTASFYAESKAYSPKIYSEYKTMRYFKIKADIHSANSTCKLTGWISDPSAFEGIGGVRIMN
ncbi:MAG TPA: hypothetical protein VGE63_02950 [Candidatus Paceibacterota bacterium]